ncbi:MAG: helix-turn-helix domain-containing protein [Halobacteriales archaeon]
MPLGERPVPFFSVSDGARNDFERQVRANPGVDNLRVVNTHEDETLYAMDWALSTDAFFEGVLAAGANVLEARGSVDRWQFELRFPSHDRLKEFHEYCTEAGLSLDVEGIYNPTNPDAGPHFGLTAAQREALAAAVEQGYYAIPRGISTQALAEEFDISDQALTERLRRAITNLVSNTLLVAPAEP